MASTKNQEFSSKCWFGCIILIIGISLIVAIPVFASISAFLIVIGVIVIVVEIGSKTRDTSKRSSLTTSGMQRRENCPNCRRKLYVNLSGDKHCYFCGYTYLQKIEPITPSYKESFPPISELSQYKKTSKLTPNDVELKTDEMKTVPEKKEEKLYINCPHCRQKLPLGVKFCAICGQKVETLEPTPPVSAIEERLPKESPTKEVQPTPTIFIIRETDEEIDLNWLKVQYYDLGRSMQDIADELGVSMIKIRKLLSKIEVVSEKKEVESMKDVLLSKTEEIEPTPSVYEKEEDLPKEIPTEDLESIPPISNMKEKVSEATPVHEIRAIPSALEEEVEKSFIICPHCGRKLPNDAKFCAGCGQTLKILKPTPPISEMKSQLSLAEESKPVNIAKEDKQKKELRVCKFCGMRIPQKNNFCLQCGMLIKSTIT